MPWIENLVDAIAEAILPSDPIKLAAHFERQAKRKMDRAIRLAMRRRRPLKQMELAMESNVLRERAQELRAQN